MRQLLGQRLVLACAADGQILALGAESGGLVTISRNPQLIGDALGEVARQGGALLQGNARNGNQRKHVGSPHTRMSPLVVPHVDELGGALHPLESRFDDRFGRTDESDDRAVGGFAGVDVQHLDAARLPDGRGNLPDDLPIAPLAEIGDALYDSLLHDDDCIMIFFDSIQM